MRPIARAALLSALILLLPLVSSASRFIPPSGEGEPKQNECDEPTTLACLILLDEEIVVGDKLFSNFGYAASGDMPSAADVNVIPITDAQGNFGVRFQGAFLDLASSSGGSDALITYDVEVTQEGLDAGFLISDAHLAGNPALLSGFGSISVTETFLPTFAAEDARLIIFDDESGGTKSTDEVLFPELVAKLSVQKDILAFAVGDQGEGTVTLSFVDQTFSQIPEPGTVGLLGMGLVGLGLASKRRR